MKINKHNLTIAQHCASENISGFITNGLQFTKTGTLAINRSYSVAVSALQTVEKEPLSCISLELAKELEAKAGDGELTVEIEKLWAITGKIPIVQLPDKPPQFEITLSANFLLTLAKSAREFDEEAIVRIQFTGNDEPIRMDARNTVSGQKWEALLMPRKPGHDAARFADAKRQQEIWFHGTTAEKAAQIREEGFAVDTWFARSMESAYKFGGPHVFFVKIAFDETPLDWQVHSSNHIPASSVVDEVFIRPKPEPYDAARFAKQLQQAKERQEPLLPDGNPNRQARPVDDELAKALAEAQQLAGL